MTVDARQLAKNTLATDWSGDPLIPTLARELLTALDDRDQALGIMVRRADAVEFDRDEAVRVIRRRAVAAEAERDRLREALRRAEPYLFNSPLEGALDVHEIVAAALADQEDEGEKSNSTPTPHDATDVEFGPHEEERDISEWDFTRGRP